MVSNVHALHYGRKVSPIEFMKWFFFSCSDLETEVPGVQNINTVCNDGSIQWISPYGALRIELSYSTGGLFEACFKIQTENVKIKVSQESWKNSKSPFASALPQSSLLKPLFNVNGRTNEYCVYSNTPVLLYLEPERTHDMSGFPRMNLQYVLERKTPQHLKNELEGKDLSFYIKIILDYL